MGIKENAITLAIAVLFTTFILVSIDTVYSRPEYNDFCKNNFNYPKVAPIETNCTIRQTTEESKCYQDGGMPLNDYDTGCPVFKECSFCNKEFESASKNYNNIFFIITATIGALGIVLGVLYSIEFIGSGFVFAGIILMLIGTVSNFQDLNKIMRLIVIFSEMVLVLFIAYKRIIPKKITKHKK